MKITNLQAVVYINTVTSMKEKNLPVKVLFALNHNFNLLMNQIKPYEEARKALLKQHNDNAEAAAPEMEKLLSETVEQPIKTLKLSYLEKIDDNPQYDKISTVEYSAIAFMLEDEETKTSEPAPTV